MGYDNSTTIDLDDIDSPEELYEWLADDYFTHIEHSYMETPLIIKLSSFLEFRIGSGVPFNFGTEPRGMGRNIIIGRMERVYDSHTFRYSILASIFICGVEEKSGSWVKPMFPSDYRLLLVEI